MNLIFVKEVAEKMQSTHTVLELETFDVNGKDITVYCVVPAEKIPLNEFPLLEDYVKLHKGFLEAMSNKNYKLCQEISEHLMGKFGGELDSFYEEILKRFNLEQKI